MTYQGRHQAGLPPAVNPLTLPGAIDVHRVAAAFHEGELFLTILAESGRVSTFAIAGEALDTLRTALLESPIRLKAACICGTGRSVQCASPRHAVSLAALAGVKP
jgi:hypothetical protein